MLLSFAQRVCAFGCLGLLIEVFFTGLHSFYIGAKSGSAKTYLVMLPIYGFGGTILEATRDLVGADRVVLHILSRAVLYAIIIFIMEFLWGALLEKVIGRCPWKYVDSESNGKIHKFSIMGFVRIDYAPYWLSLAVVFDLFSPLMQNFINAVSRL